LEIARGRVWTGEDAKELGLVDELGGFPVAFRLVREAVGLSADAKIKLKQFPPRKSPLQALLGEDSDSSQKVGDETIARALEIIQPLARVARDLGLVADPDILRKSRATRASGWMISRARAIVSSPTFWLLS